jgi:hypothetical protein
MTAGPGLHLAVTHRRDIQLRPRDIHLMCKYESYLEGYNTVIPYEMKLRIGHQLHTTFSRTADCSWCRLLKAQHKELLKMQIRLPALIALQNILKLQFALEEHSLIHV